MTHSMRPAMMGVLGLVTLAACQTAPTLRPAILSPADEAATSAVKTKLAQVLNRATVEIVPAELSGAIDLSVLPPPLGPLETRSPVLPTQFTFQTDGAACYLVRTDTGEQYLLNGLNCRVAPE